FDPVISPPAHRAPTEIKPTDQPVMVGPLPLDFPFLPFLPPGVALFHNHTLQVALTGLIVVTIYKLVFTGFPQGPGVAGLLGLFAHEWVILANLFGLLMGFALLSKHFEDSNVPVELPKILPDDWKGGFWLLVIVFANVKFPAVLDRFPVIGAAVWAAILVSAPIRKPAWSLMPSTFRGTIFLLALVATAAMMPVEKLPAASWETAFGLGVLSAVFDNIPLTALALHQGGYDW